MKMRKYTSIDEPASKRVSFIMTTKNRAEHLREALESNRKLMHPEDELIVIDGLSTDNTAEVVKEYADLVDVFVSEPDKSGAHALNKGILLSRGKYIKQLPDDDVFYPEAMEQAIQVMEEHPEVDLLVCGGTRQLGDKLSTVYIPPGTDYGSSIKDVFTYGATGVGFIYRRSSLARIGLLHPTGMAADNEIVLRAVSRGANVKFCRINLFYHRIYEHSVSVNQQREWKADRNRLLRQYYPSRFLVGYRVYRVYKWCIAGFMRWLLGNPRLYNLAKTTRDRVKKPAPPGETGNFWDGGFS